MGCNVERVLGEIGQSLRPMSEAPRDGRGILGNTAVGLMICHWVDPAKLKLWDYAALADLLIAYIDDAHAAGDTKALRILDRRVMGRDGTN
jgi:hypothetical protein